VAFNVNIFKVVKIF